MNYTFSKTSQTFTNPTAYINHVRSYCRVNNLSTTDELYREYCETHGEHYCPHCNKVTEYINCTIGFREYCYTPECYKIYVKNNWHIYRMFCEKSYIDPYDNKEYKTSFNKIYYNRTNEICSAEKEFYKTTPCKVCGKNISSKFIKRISTVCSDKCKHIQIGRTRSPNKNIEFTEYDIPNTIQHLNKYWHDKQTFPDDPFYKSVKGKRYISRFITLRKISKGAKEHFSVKYDMWFYLSNINTLKIFLSENKISYFDYHKENNVGKIEKCLQCDVDILVEDVFGISIGSNKFCSQHCYLHYVRDGKHERKHSNITKNKQSKLVREKIKNGSWTPNIHNSRTHHTAEAIINGVTKRFRSSWEAVYAVLNPSAQFEKVRLPYMYNGVEHIYIVDFFKNDTKELIELKPECQINSSKYILKREAAQHFCQDKGYIFIEHTEKYFLHLVQDRGIIDLLKQKLTPNTFTLFLKGIHYEDVNCEIH